MTMIKYTPEQADILDHMASEDGILLVSAGAGTGKSFTAKHVAQQMQPKTGLYTAFNKAIVEEGNSRFKGTNIECKTLHALAYKYVKPKSKINDLTYTCIEENITYTKKYQVITAIDMFYVSASTDMWEYFQDYFSDFEDKDVMVELCGKYVEKMADGTLNPTFNFMLKYFHLLLVEEKVHCSYDLVILDEINDTTAVALEIFKLINAPKKLGLGETNQAIYQFLNLVDGFEEMSDVPQLTLTQSFRCSESIAARIEKFMISEVKDDFKFIGTDEPVENGLSLYCTMTNASIVTEINKRLAQGLSFHLLRKPADIFAAPLALMSVNSGKEPYQKKYKFLMDEYKFWMDSRHSGQTFFQYLLEHVDDVEINNAIRLLLSFKKQGINLFDIYKRAKEITSDPKYTIATVFTSKGLEFETVTIADDLNTRIQGIRDNGGIETQEDLVAFRCYYVACSRAGRNLHNATMLPK